MSYKLVAIYARVSTEEQARKGTSIDTQVEMLKEHCRKHNYKIYKTYIDKGFSGANLKRPQLQNLLKDANYKKFELLLVLKIDRLSRNVKDIVRIVLDDFEKLNISFKAINEPYDTTARTGKLFFTLLAGFADFERETIKERTMAGRQKRAEEGKNPGFGVPLGYKVKNGEFIIDEYYEPVVKEIYKLFLEGNSFFKIASILNERNIPARKSGKWRDVTVNKILKNIRYTGQVSIKLGGIDYELNNLIPPIIDKNTFENAQARRSVRGKLAPTTKPKYLLSGKDLMICKFCGSGLVHVNKKYVNKTGKVKYITPCYHDNNRTFGIECGKLKIIRAERIEPLIIFLVKQVMAWLQKDFKKLYIEDMHERIENKEIKALDNQYFGLKKRRDNLLSAVEKGVDIDDLKDRLDQLKLDMQDNREKKDKLHMQTKKIAGTIKNAGKITGNYIKILHTKPIHVIRGWIELFIEKIIIDNDKVKIKWNRHMISSFRFEPDKDTFKLYPPYLNKPWSMVKKKKKPIMVCAKCGKEFYDKGEAHMYHPTAVSGKYYCASCYVKLESLNLKK